MSNRSEKHRFIVVVARKSEQFARIEVDASHEAAAIRAALKIARDDDSNCADNLYWCDRITLGFRAQKGWRAWPVREDISE